MSHMREFIGAMTASSAKTGIFVALSGLTSGVKSLASDNQIEGITGDDLADMSKALFE